MDQWREKYMTSGFRQVEPLEYIPCPGSIKFCDLKPQEEERCEEICTYPDEEVEPDLYGFDT